MQANLIDNLKFELDGFGASRGEDVRLKLARMREIQKKEIADLKAKYISNAHFRDWMDKAYQLGCDAIAAFNTVNGSTLSVQNGLRMNAWAWDEMYEEEYTSEMVIESLSEHFDNYI